MLLRWSFFAVDLGAVSARAALHRVGLLVAREERVVAGRAAERVDTAAAGDRVVSVGAAHRVGAAAAVDDVVSFRAVQEIRAVRAE